jgi:hypothetical protein
MNLEIVGIIIGSVTLLVTGLSSYLSYRLGKQSIKLQKQTKRLNSIEKKYKYALQNLETLYMVEEHFLTDKLDQSSRSYKIELTEWLKEKGLTLDRKSYCESYFKDEKKFLDKE